MNPEELISRLPSREKEALEESLATVYKAVERGENTLELVREKLAEEVSSEVMDRFLKSDSIIVSDGKVKLSPKGDVLARKIIRRSRLSERLLADVLEVHNEALSTAACQFEHVLSEEIADSICTLLGHPTECPHQNPIPQGECCKNLETVAPAVVTPLSKVEPNKKARVAYLQFKKNPEIYQLLSLGLVPGQMIRVIQCYPTYVVECGEAQLALDESMAAHIFVRPV